MIDSKNKFNSIFFRNIIYLALSFIVSFCISIKKSDALPHEWVGVPKVNMENSYGIGKVYKGMKMVL